MNEDHLRLCRSWSWLRLLRVSRLRVLVNRQPIAAHVIDMVQCHSSFGEDEVRLSIFRSLGEKFVKVDLPSVDEKIPKPENDPELKDTKLDSEMSDSEPMRWAGPNMIAFRKHLLYQPKDKPAEYANEIHRRYEIAMTIGDDGKVTTETKQIKGAD